MSVMEGNAPIFDTGLCRCCGIMQKQKCRVLNVKYESCGETEVYCDMIMDCFGILLSNLDGNPAERLICVACIQRLREASDFYQQVLRCEELLKDMDEAIENEAESIKAYPKSVLEVKMESEDSNNSPCRNDSDSECALELEEYNNSKDDRPLQTMITNKSSKYEVMEKHKLDNVKRFSDIKGKRTLNVRSLPTMMKHPKVPTRKLMLKPQNKNGSNKLKQGQIRLPRIKQNKDPPMHNVTNCKVEHLGKMADILNALTILQYSNATPFKSLASSSKLGIPCYYCRNVFENLDMLKNHQLVQHKKTDLKKILSRYRPGCLIVYADVTDLKCTICNEVTPKLTDLKAHLIKDHKTKMYTECNDRVIPFKLGDSSNGASLYVCQICEGSFQTFGSIERHMNFHFRNYVCNECGTSYVTKYRLTNHIKRMHMEGSFPCDVCKKVFTSLEKRKSHVDAVHKLLKRLKCPECPERFTEYMKRQNHMVEFHGVAPLTYKCDACDKSFARRYTLTNQMKRFHLEERNVLCQICTYKCFTTTELRFHMIKHNGERVHECSVCKKSYARKKTLVEHMRIHNNDRRFVCTVCGQAFVQNCSLKGHMKTHHSK